MAETKSGATVAGPRCAALAGPYQSGKTSLLEALMFASGSSHKKGTVKDGSTIGDSSPEARDRGMTVELISAAGSYLDQDWHFIDCPGSIEFFQDAMAGMAVADVVVLVCEPEIEKAVLLSPYLKYLEERDIPHMIFINKIDHARTGVRDLLQALQNYSSKKLLLRHIPIRDGEMITGYIDVTPERAYRYNSEAESERTDIPDGLQEREEEARQELLETLADFDDALLEQLLEEVDVSTAEIYDQLTKDLQEDLIVPVFFGAAESENGVRRLLKALRHEAPPVETTYERLAALDALPDAGQVAQIFKTYYVPHVGKISLARVWRGGLKDGDKLGDFSAGNLSKTQGLTFTKTGAAAAGDVVAIGRQDELSTGQVISSSGTLADPLWPAPMPPVYSQAIHTPKREDEVKLSSGLARLADEDPSLTYGQDADTLEMLLHGRGESHLRLAIERLETRYHVGIEHQMPKVPYKETIRKGMEQHARHKKQSGGHGEFGDVTVEVKPLPRGQGFEFIDQITGGVVPRQYIPAVEAGVRDYMTEGPLGFQVVDVSVRLFDGKHHPVDSSEMAFRRAGILAMKEALPSCSPVLLEPIASVTIAIPSDFTSRAQGVVTKRRGQILGFDTRPGWLGWDELKAQMPQSELNDLIFELRSLSLGVADFTWTFDHLAELSGRLSDEVIETRRSEAA